MTPPQPRRWPLSAATLAWVGLGLVYAATRLINLTQMPLFTDEGIYLWFGRQVLLGIPQQD